MATKTLQYRIGMDIGELRRKAEEAGNATRAFKRELTELEAKQRAHRKSMDDLGRGMATFGAATVAGLGLAAKAAIDWESAFAGVRKTVDGSGPELAALEGELRSLARTLPATHKEIAAVAEAAGQLGIKRKDIAGFTKTMVDLGETTNLSADEAATALAKFSNVMGTSASDADKLGSTLVALGNDGASTEKDIVEMALRIAGAGKQIHLTESQVLGFASALSSVGIEAEAGGSSISRVMVDIASAVNDGGSKLEAFAEVAGMSGAQFATAFKMDAGGAVSSFIQGLGRMQKSGDDVFGTLAGLELNEIRVRDALLRAGAASNVFTNSLRVGSKAWEENSALTDEANKRYETSASKLKVAWNQIQDALIDVGAAVVPVVSNVAGGIAEMVRGFQQLPGPIRDVVTWVGLVAAGIGLAGGAALIAAPKVMAFRASMTAMAAAGGAGSKALAGFGRALVGPVGLALTAGTILLGIFAAKSGAAAAAQDKLRAEAKEIADAISEQNGQIDTNIRKLTAKKAADEEILQVTSKLGIEGGKVVEAILGEGDAYNEVIRIMGERFNAAKDSDPSSIIDGEAKVIIDAMTKMRGLRDETNKGVEANKLAKGATEGATAAQKNFAAATGLTETESKEAAEALDGLIKAMDRTNTSALTARGAERDFRQSVDDAYTSLQEQMNALDANEVAMGDRARTLDINTEAGRKNAATLDEIATNANDLAKAVSATAEANGGAAAGAAAMTASLEASRPVLIDIAKMFGMGQVEAEKYANEVLKLPEVPPMLVTTPGSQQAIGELKRVKEALDKAGASQGGFNRQLGQTGQKAKTAKEKLDEMVDSLESMNDTSLNSRDARRRQLEAIDSAKETLKEQMEALDGNEVAFGERARTLNEHTDMGRKNQQALDDQARAALDLAKAVAREAEANGGAAAGTAALTNSLKASRPLLIETAKMFGMNQAQAQAYADDVLAIPKVSSVHVATPGSKESQAELQRVKNKADAIPGEKWVNVGVLSQTALAELEKFGFKVQRLPNGEVIVNSNTAPGQAALDHFIASNSGRSIPIYTQTIGGIRRRKDIEIYGAHGAVVAFAGGGMMGEDHRPQIAHARPGTVRVWAEPETGSESYIPWAMDRRRQAVGVLKVTADAFGYDLMPRSTPMRTYSHGGITGSVAVGSSGGVLEIVSDGSRRSDLLLDELRHSIRVRGGNVQVVLGSS